MTSWRKRSLRVTQRIAERSAASVGEEFHSSEDQGQEAGREASQREDEGQPAGVSVRTLPAYSSEDGEGEQNGEDSRAEDPQAGGEKFFCVWLHRAGNRA